jgi:hypothetical protein
MKLLDILNEIKPVAGNKIPIKILEGKDEEGTGLIVSFPKSLGFPNLTHNLYVPNSVLILSITFDKNKKKILEFIKQKNIPYSPWPNSMDNDNMYTIRIENPEKYFNIELSDQLKSIINNYDDVN